jgi:pimeloyl-ACP methyl ester carboxylesterase
MQPLFEHRLSLAGYETRALELEGGGPPLLLLHGYADSADTWRITLDRLARTERRAVALDLPGFGAADPLSPGPILPQLDAFADAAVAHFAPGGRALVAGNSLGGCVALRLAERETLAGVVAVAPAGLEMARWFLLIEREPFTRLLLGSPLPIPGVVTRAIVAELYKRLAFRHPGRLDRVVATTFAGHFVDRATARRLHATGQRMLHELRNPFRLERISCPVLLVWGRQDVLVFQTGAERVLEAVGDARLEVIEDCGHCPQIEAPERFTELLLDFPARLARAA